MTTARLHLAIATLSWLAFFALVSAMIADAFR
jgi:hypothetical protein